MFEYTEGHSGPTGYSKVFRNIPDDLLQPRIVDRWDRGELVTWDGETADSTRSKIVVVKTDKAVDKKAPWDDISAQGSEVTNEWVTGPAGASLPAQPSASGERESPLRDHRRVMVVHGRNTGARDAMFTFLRALGLIPIEWEQAIRESGAASPHNLDAVRAAMDIAQAVVVVLTAEDRAGLLPVLADGDEAETELRGQPRQNVVLEAGLALGVSVSERSWWRLDRFGGHLISRDSMRFGSPIRVKAATHCVAAFWVRVAM